MCVQWIASATCAGAGAGAAPRAGCKGTHVAVTRREVCAGADEACVCFFGSCGAVVTLSAQAQQGTVVAPCEACGVVDGDPEEAMLLRVFDGAFAAEWAVAFGGGHSGKCAEGRWRGRLAADEGLAVMDNRLAERKRA
ncbi:hypothetical protein LX36DRAFT_704344 [Colletotrichum falcatum]|nr:hypothetical protein LX36DRAFT_704344 [Colletotrichum falcatum]